MRPWTEKARWADVELCEPMSMFGCRWIQTMSRRCVRWPHWSVAASTRRPLRLTCAKLCPRSQPTRSLYGYCLRLIACAVIKAVQSAYHCCSPLRATQGAAITAGTHQPVYFMQLHQLCMQEMSIVEQAIGEFGMASTHRKEALQGNKRRHRALTAEAFAKKKGQGTVQTVVSR